MTGIASGCRSPARGPRGGVGSAWCPSCAQGVGGCQGSDSGGAALDRAEAVGRDREPRAPHRPPAAWSRTLAEGSEPRPKWTQPSWPDPAATADIELASDDVVTNPDLDPGADDIPVRARAGSPVEREPSGPSASGLRVVARPNAPPELDRIAIVDARDQAARRGSSRPGPRPAFARSSTMPGSVRLLDESCIGLAEEEVARVLLGIVGDSSSTLPFDTNRSTKP